ncbi:MAG TPA: TolC family protein [Chitinophagaceae bacterium]|nr:TolC family protein [Chitinophagaceae bacterium]
MKKYISVIAAMGSILFGVNIHAQQILTLNAILDTLSKSNPVLIMYNYEIRSMDEAARGARSWMPPQLSLGQFMTPYNVGRWNREGDEPGMGSVMISGEQMIPNKIKLDADEQYMKAMSPVEKEKLNATLNELRFDAKSLYFEWIVLKRKLTLLGQNEKLLDFMLKNAELRYKNGLEKINAYYKAKAALGKTKNMQLMYESEIREKRIQLNSLMGRNAQIDFEIEPFYTLNDYSSLVFDQTLFYHNRSDLKAIDKDINLTWLKRESEKQSLKPQFGIRYDHMIGFGGQPMLYTIMGMVRIPMAKWSSKMNYANMERLKWKVQALQSQKEMLVNEYSGMAYSMRNELDLKKKQLTLYEENIIPAIKNNYKTMQLAYEQNTEDLFMLFDSWEILNMTQLEYLDLLNQALKLQVALERIIEMK